MLMRFDPFRELDRLTEQISSTARAPRSFPIDAYRSGEQFIVEMDLPGVNPDAIELTVEQNVLTVRAERRFERAQGEEVLVSERPQGTYTRQLFLGETLDQQGVQASYDHGVLRLTIPVAERAKPRRVQITATQSQPETVPAGGGAGSGQSGAQDTVESTGTPVAGGGALGPHGGGPTAGYGVSSEEDPNPKAAPA